MIDGETGVLGLLGWPLAHSLSPFFQNYLLSLARQNLRYVPFPVRPEADLRAALRGLALAGVLGVNVTVPHKVAAARACDELLPEAEATGAANTILMTREGRLRGANTDVAGFLAPLLARSEPLAGRGALVLGAGGAARAVAYALARAGSVVTVAARRRSAADEVAASIEAATEGHLGACEWDARHEALLDATLLVNATTVGMAGRAGAPAEGACPLEEGAPLGPAHLVYDLVYRPLVTPLLRKAREAGARTLDGLDMLIAQGIASLEAWTGVATLAAHAAETRRRCEEELRRPC
jgi:shikimate dehydrogenase